MNTNKEDMRELAAQLYAIVISTMTGNELQMAVQNLIKITRDNHVRCTVSRYHVMSVHDKSTINICLFCVTQVHSKSSYLRRKSTGSVQSSAVQII